MFPVECYAGGLGKVISCTGRNDAKCGVAIRAHDAVGCLVNAAVSTSHNNTSSATINTAADLFFEVTHMLAQVYLQGKPALAKKFTYSQRALAGTATTGGWIEEQVDGLDGH